MIHRRGFLTLPWAAAAAQRRARPPNIVLILADDLGWSDLACYGSDLHETPHLDRLAREGVRFTHACAAAPVCTPTRAALMTGKHPARLGITIWSEGAIEPPKDRKLIPAPSLPDLPLSEVTLAERLQAAGYLTALVGKWHLGDAGHYPETQGFDINIGGSHWGAPQTFFAPYRGSRRFGGEYRYVPGLHWPREGEYLTDRLTDEALAIIDRAASRPFFLYLAHHAPHTPIESHKEKEEKYRRRIRDGMKHRNAAYAGMIESLDESVGRVVARLRERNLLDNTLFVFTSDNGGYINEFNGQPPTSNAPLRSGKGSLYEGGLRVPLIVRWPGRAREGAVCGEPVVTNDLFATLLAAAGQDASAADGMSLDSLLANPAGRLPREELYFHYPHYYPTTTPVSAVRERRWKLLEYFEDGKLELFDLQADPYEKSDVAAANPGETARLRAKLDSWRRTVGARLPRARE